jgi:hypothetical protein
MKFRGARMKFRGPRMKFRGPPGTNGGEVSWHIPYVQNMEAPKDSEHWQYWLHTCLGQF